ncbi:hypothetical protein ULF88_17330 [Halopseudomonas pachastrellae]|uniref:hypothetical protein n=1 Tax=Pseudomonas sp. TaxID=306 RepID=UPI002CEDC0F7|nr:hypothetical protein [Halopseudomonas pachastrellae]|tara:strand:- start:11009 stop:11203 length:195 start_codon:yes stop_codon:yes gene_type:complete
MNDEVLNRYLNNWPSESLFPGGALPIAAQTRLVKSMVTAVVIPSLPALGFYAALDDQFSVGHLL